jgi:heme/copper-type cytochrome/quinol oxidase subunit 3
MVLAAPAFGVKTMTATRTLDVSHLPPCEISNRNPLFWGQVMLCLIEGSMFAMLIAMYFYLRLGVDVWPPPGVKMPPLLRPTLELVPLLLSGIGSYWASEAAKKGSQGGMIGGLGLNLALAILFLMLRGWSWGSLNFTWSSDAHGSIVWAILFLHTYDVIADLLMTAVLILIVASGRFGEKQRIGVHVDSVVWYFLMAIWLPLYVVVYWGPHLVGGPR